MQKQSAMREKRLEERAEWINKVKNQSVVQTVKDTFSLYKCHPLKAVMRHEELAPGFQPKNPVHLQKELD